MADADAAALVAAQVHHGTATLLGDTGHGRGELWAAVAAPRTEDVAGEALAVHPDEHRLAVVDVALHEGEVLHAVELAAVGHAGERAPLGGHGGRSHAGDQLLVTAAVLDELRDRRQQQAVLGAEAAQLGQARHRAVVVGDLADHTHRRTARHAGQIDRCLGVAGALQHAAVAGPQREDVTRPGEGGERVRAVGECSQRGGAVGGRDAGRGALDEVDGVGERRAVALRVLLHHQRQAQLLAAGAGERRAHDAAGVAHEEGELLGRRVLGGHDQVALVLTVLVVDHHHDLAAADRGEDVLDLGERIVRAGLSVVPVRFRRCVGGGERFVGHGCSWGTSWISRSGPSRRIEAMWPRHRSPMVPAPRPDSMADPSSPPISAGARWMT